MSFGVGQLGSIHDPWRPRRGPEATAREKAVEDIGPDELRASSRAGEDSLVNTNADYWTRLVGLAWRRDVVIDLEDEPVDLDGDGVADARVTRHVRAPGGVLANPDLFGLVPTPDDPAGRVGRISISTGFLGLREPLRADGTASGQIGMTCFLCHGDRNPADGRVTLGLPATRLDYGLLLATAQALDDGDAARASYRRQRAFPSGRTVRARLLLAGPGRQDLTAEFGLDVTVPDIHSAAYAGTGRVRQRPGGVVNPLSVPAALYTEGLELQNWSGSEISDGPWLARLSTLAGGAPADTLAAFDLDRDDPARARRDLLLDLRNLGTLGLQQDAWPALLWADAIYGRATVDAETLAAVPPMFATREVRRTLASEGAALRRPPGDAAQIARGRAIFVDRVVGVIANRQIVKTVPRAFAAAGQAKAFESALGTAALAPIDPARPLTARLGVRCADCHSGAPLDNRVSLDDHPPPLGRCTHCHRAHPPADEKPGVAWVPIERAIRARAPLSAKAEVTACADCHNQHRDFGPLVFSNSQLLPFDADGDGAAQDDEADDGAAGGIGTEALLAFDVPRPQRPGGRFSVDLPVIANVRRAGAVGRARLGVPWVRVPPLRALFASAPYLHNGSVPTLRTLLEPADHRPVTFPLGRAGFVFDTRLPGNRNCGHEFGTRLTDAEKDDLVAFLRSL
ncbi:MAG TPA: cytochrome c3 family protein [Polyangia bacterium]|nr:cytochrome c3 family protein [Polyangia bacterium]